MKKCFLLSLILLTVCLLAFSACNSGDKLPNKDGENNNFGASEKCQHSFGNWTTVKMADCKNEGKLVRACDKCLETEESVIPTTDLHTEVIDAAVSVTCTTDGKTEGRHCSVCGEVTVAQIIIQAPGHAEVIDAAVAATCTADGNTEGRHCSRCDEILVARSTVGKLGHHVITDAAVAATCTADGKTEGSHCDRCNAVFLPQTKIPSPGHNYNDGEITVQATCTSKGVKKFSCQAQECTHSYVETYSLPTYSAAEIYELSVSYVGEIVTYDRRGAELSLGTGIVISSDGMIVTNYHVFSGAYSANITINGKKYAISSVLAYDAGIDLAIIKIKASGLTAATICTSAVTTGETVYAIGSSRGMTNTISQGIVSYANRVVGGVTYVQHDASITHGNSGGPLINVYGEVIGINTWGYTDSQNLNFAIFTTELDKLTYGAPLSMAEFYELTKNNQ